MTLVKRGNSLLLKSGALATGQGCCCGGSSCCTCTTNYQQWSANNKPPSVPDGSAFCTPEERSALEGQMYDAMQAIIDAAHSSLTAGGWTCVGGQGDVFTDVGPNTSGDFLYSPDCELGVEVYGAVYSGLFVDAYCCGTVDTEGEPIDLGFDGHQAYPCVGPYTYDVCADNVPADQCCGIHHPGKTCQQKPCCCITPPQPPLDDCDGFNLFWAQCTNYCEECTCESPNGEQRYDSCLDGLEEVLQQQGFEPVHYDEYAVTGPEECNTGTYLYGRDVLACCNGELSFFTADEAVWKSSGSAWEQAPCFISCGILSGGRLRSNGDLVISKCINPLP